MKKPNTEKYIYQQDKIIGYRLGHMDLYSVAVQYTPLENSSFFHCVFKESINKDKLIDAIKVALNYFPLFKTQLAYKREFYLKINNGDVSKTIKNCAVNERPLKFGAEDTTGGFLFQICYFNNNISFEWCHAVSDGRGALEFFSCILDVYFGVDIGVVPASFPLDLPYESIYDKTVRMFGQVKQENGFKSESLPLISNGYKCRNTTLKIPTQDVLKLSKRLDATPVAILTPLLCKAIREHIPLNAKNRNVSCGIVIDGRKSLDFPTMHNCVFNKVITYTDRIDEMELQKQGTIYRSILDLFCQKENLVSSATQMLDAVDAIYRLKPVWMERRLMKFIAPIVKTNMNNIAFTYIGRVPFSETVKSQMTDFNFRSWPDIGGCVCAMADLNGTLILDITDNYEDGGIVDSFIKICHENNIDVKKETPFIFEQANVRI